MQKIIVTDMGQLPVITGIENLYMDLETTSRDPKLKSLDPWRNCWVAGVAFTVDDCDTAWYIPVGHAQGRNMLRHRVIQYVSDLVRESKRWVNHNVKYDMHCLRNDFGIEPPNEVRCTVVSAKTLDSDRYYAGGYGLDALTRAWLKRGDEDGKQKAALAPYLVRNHDFGRIPIDVIGPYACQDAFLARDLDAYIEERMPKDCKFVHGIEQQMTLALYDMERRGLRVDPVELKKEQLRCTVRLTQIEDELAKLVGYEFNPSSTKDCEQLFCGHYGSPVLMWGDEEGNIGSAQETRKRAHTASFSIIALNRYRKLENLPPTLVDLMLEYRHLSQYHSLFVLSYQELATQDGNGRWALHPSYNQAVKTFRMSCNNPNIQQASPAGWKLVHPDPGRAFIAMDEEQEELRIVAHYAKSGDAIRAYIEDPDIDYHKYVQDMCGGIMRSVAKAINFTMTYGGGKNRVLNTMLRWGYDEMEKLLAPNVDKLIDAGKIKLEQRAGILELMMRKRAEEIWDTFNSALPEMINVRNDVARVFETRGFVRNLYGRRLGGPTRLSYIAFNKIVQSTAAEFFKDLTVQVSPRNCPEMRERDVHIVASIHDSLLFDAPVEVAQDREFVRWLRQRMCEPQRLMRIPLRASVSIGCDSAYTALKDKHEEKRCKEWLGPYEAPYVVDGEVTTVSNKAAEAA